MIGGTITTNGTMDTSIMKYEENYIKELAFDIGVDYIALK
jgi:hypothetical protein